MKIPFGRANPSNQSRQALTSSPGAGPQRHTAKTSHRDLNLLIKDLVVRRCLDLLFAEERIAETDHRARPAELAHIWRKVRSAAAALGRTRDWRVLVQRAVGAYRDH